MSDARFRADRWLMIALAAAMALFGIAGFSLVFFAGYSGRWAGEKLCDREVAILLASRDPIDLQRAGIIIREVPCSIGRRLK